MNPHVTAAIIIGFLVPAMAMLAGHWFPWKKLFGRELTRIQAYAYGTGWIVGVPCIVLAIWQEWLAIVVIIASTSGAALATLAAYALDTWAEQRHQLLDEQDRASYASLRNINQADSAD
jgi:hypothetical protein